jgi:hypothetical protein
MTWLSPAASTAQLYFYDPCLLSLLKIALKIYSFLLCLTTTGFLLPEAET